MLVGGRNGKGIVKFEILKILKSSEIAAFFFEGREILSKRNVEISRLNDIDMDIHLSSKQKASARALTLTLEHHLYWLILILRWVYEDGQFMRNVFPCRNEDSLMSRAKAFFMRRRISSVAAKVL